MVLERFFDHRSELTQALSEEIARRIADGVRHRGEAGLLITGGSTPGPLYDALSVTDAPWDKTTLTLTDERWVDMTDPASNEGLVRSHLLKGRAAAAHLVGLKTPAVTPGEALPVLEAAVAAIPAPYDVVLLGMGGDGHVASLFPHAPELAAAFDADRQDRVCAVHRADAYGAADRISLTLRALLDARWIAVLIQGEDKRDAYRKIAGLDRMAAPIQAVLDQQKVPVEVWWAP